MSGTEILEELPKLKSEGRHTLFVRLNELGAADIEETPEMVEAIDAGIRSLEQNAVIPFELVRSRLEAKWRTA